MEVGIFGGRFTPLHNGHIGAILRAAEEVDALFVVLSYASDDPIRGKVRLKWLNAVFSQYDNIKVLFIKRDKILETVDEWLEDAKNIRIAMYYRCLQDEEFQILEKFNYDGDNVRIDKVFVGSNDHDDMFKKCYPEAEVVVLDPLRSDITISGTEIRKNIYTHWEYLPKFVRKDYAKVVAVADTKLRNQLTDRFSTVKVEDVIEKYLAIYGKEVITQKKIQNVIKAKMVVLCDEAAYNANRVYFIPDTREIGYPNRVSLFIESRVTLDDAIEKIKDLIK